MDDKQRKLLADIQEAVNSIDDHLSGKRDFDVYLSNKTVRRAVERELEIIGEAVSKLLRLNSEIPLSYARQIIDMRNRVIHSYDTVDHVIVWKTVVKDLPVLKKEVESLLKS